jgi:hypothetical protein
MSTIQANAILDASGGNTTTVNGVTPNSDVVKGRNLIINGAMNVAQRGSTFTAPNGAYTSDRYQFYQANGAVFDVKTSTDAPDGFGGSLEVDCTTAAASPASNSYAQMVQRIEGQDLQVLAYGTSSAKKITLSFWVKSNKTGNYQVNFRKTQSPAQMANKTYTINAADTWEYKSVTVDGATGFSLVTDNTQGLMVDWWYHSGTDYSSGSGSETYIAFSGSNYNSNGTANLGDNTSNYLRMTGVKLEVGSVATEFDHRSYGEELSLCQRYFFNPLFGRTTGSIYYPINFNQVSTGNNGLLRWQVTFPVSMRTSPTLTHSLTDAKFQTSAPNGTDNWAFYKQNSGWASKVGNSDISVLNIAPSVNQANVGAYYVTPSDTLATAIGIGGGATFNFSSEL